MAEDQEIILLEETETCLESVQNYDANSLIRASDLGKYAFDAAVKPAQRVIDLFSILNIKHLEHFPSQQLTTIKSTAETFENLLDQFNEFDVANASPDVESAQQSLIDQLENQYQTVFNQLQPLISFATVRSQDFTALTQKAQKAVDQIETDTSNLLTSISNDKESAAETLKNMRELAAEQGVSSQAIHFNTEAEKHNTEAKTWLVRSIWTSIGLGSFAVISIFIHKWGLLSPSNAYETIQLAISKILIFGVIAYMLILCARNFMSHKHNEIINRHRQNALTTFTALSEATSDAASSDVVLSHAASCIFSPQDTGYTKNDNNQSEKVPSFQITPRIGGIGSQSS